MRKEEMETVLRFDMLDNCWYAYSTIPKHINAMKKKGWQLLHELEESASFKGPAHSVKISKTEKPNKRSISEEQRDAMRKRLAAAREAKKIDKII